MNNIIKLIEKIVVIIGGIFTLIQFNLVSQEIGIFVIIIFLVFFICFQELVGKFDLLRNPLAEIQKFLKKEMEFVPVHPVEPKGFTQSYSPVKLTGLGEKLLNESGAKNVIDNNFETLEKKIDEQNLKSAYDIQAYIQHLVFRMANKDVMLPIKNFVYKNPKYKNTELELTDIQRTMVIYLRDEYFKKHPEILDDLDK